MRINPIFIIMTISLAAIGSWGVWKINANNSHSSAASLSNSEKKTEDRTLPSLITSQPDTAILKTGFNANLTHIKNLLSHNEFTQATKYINDRYSALSSEELSVIKTLFINFGLLYSDNGQLKKAQRLYLASASLFDGVEILDSLSNVSIELGDWQTALDALLKSSLLESRPQTLSNKLVILANIATRLKNEFSASSDLESSRQLYQTLYEAHPGYAQFQLELALTYLSLGDTNNAKQLFSAIQYDLDVGNIAQQQLDLLEAQEHAASIEKQNNVKTPAKPNNDIHIALVRAGNSFLVDGSINGKQTRLLLDTGASITALSPDLIARLRLSPTGDVVRLSTANGVTEAQLFLAKRITLGQITVRDLIVAEINLGNNQSFQGLLGTDLLNKVGAGYSYLIDNENNALIFRRKSR